MNLKVLLPTEILVDEPVTKVVAEAENGSFGLLPNHIDFVTALVPGIMSFESPQGSEQFLAVDQGILVKQGPEVFISTRKAMQSADLEKLKHTVSDEFTVLDEQEKKSRTALANLESNFVQHFIQMDKPTYG